MALTGDLLVVRARQKLLVYDARSGALLSAWPFRGTLEAAHGEFAVSVLGRDLTLLDLRDGRSSLLRAPSLTRRFRRGYFFEQLVHADLTAAGLFYSYNVDDRRDPGRVVFVPQARLTRSARAG